jgi:hypothetical protein
VQERGKAYVEPLVVIAIFLRSVKILWDFLRPLTRLVSDPYRVWRKKFSSVCLKPLKCIKSVLEWGVKKD